MAIPSIYLRTFVQAWNAENGDYPLDTVITRCQRSVNDRDDHLGFRFLDWLLREWSATWIEWLTGHGAGPTVATFRPFAVRLRTLPAIDSQETLLFAVPVVLDFVALVEHAARALPEETPGGSSVEAENAIHGSGWYAAIETAEDGCTMSRLADAMLDRLHHAVYHLARLTCAEADIDFDDILGTLHGSAQRLVENLNADGERQMADEPAIVGHAD